MAQRTVFGWVLTGPIDISPKNSISVFTTFISYAEEENLNENLLKFWELEEPPKRKNLSPSDRRCEEIYRNTTKRNSKGRYIVSLPFKPEFPQEINLGISKTGVLKQFVKIETSLMRKPDVRRMYDEVLKEYLELDHMRTIKAGDLAVKHSCYLPHLPVLKPESKTTKLRVVFNASNRTAIEMAII
ncbi:uncharacterized protein LOC119613923 [Lucilia sericata]|uniref:uncharacterized protein LOC119613923 n=1 Tax=Lucilia sericata TaxID=13632 RepID=UPI0018A81C08|nr:uncharacterized protein LOC119613923 [Lucilia sericata]